ncbi:hypothetical protein [Kitasatospora kazusensis]|uniref:hypothetical protein n=1 Tax=Kitasatospora kazusensis TaxID=407974 RepID=UPI0031E3FD9D
MDEVVAECGRVEQRHRLLPGDRGFRGFDLWRAVAATGADLLWRAKSDSVLPVLAALEDGSCLSQIFAARGPTPQPRECPSPGVYGVPEIVRPVTEGRARV